MAVAGLSIRPFFDHNVHTWFAPDLRRAGFDVVHAKEVGNDRASDEEHLLWATRQGRTVVTYDRDDFPILAQRWAEQGLDHAGIILAIAPPVISAGLVLRRLHAFLDTVSADEMVNQVRWLDGSWDINE